MDCCPRLAAGAASSASYERLTRGMCPYAGALLGASLSSAGWSDVAGLVLATTCDQMRYVAAMLEQRGDRPVFLLNVPSTWQTPAARLYLDELRRLGRFLGHLGGKTPSGEELTHVMLALDRVRAEDRANSRGPTARGELSRWGDSCTVAPGGGSATAPNGAGRPAGDSGGPLLETDCEFFALVERAGGRVVLDATEHGQRTLPARSIPADSPPIHWQSWPTPTLTPFPMPFGGPTPDFTSGSTASWPRGKCEASFSIVIFGATSGTRSRND